MTIIRLNSPEDITSKVSRRYSEIQIKGITTDEDTSKRYVKGKITKKSALQKTKRFNYMKFSLQDDSETDISISVFVTGDTAEDIDKLRENTLVLLQGFLVENNTRFSDGSHRFQLVLDTEISIPNVWYLPDDKKKGRSSPSKPGSEEAFQGRQLGSNACQTHSNQEKGSSLSLIAKKQPLSFVSSRVEGKNTGVDIAKNSLTKSPVKRVGISSGEQNQPSSSITGKQQPESRRQKITSEQCSNRKAEADSTTPEKSSPGKLLTLRSGTIRQPQNLNRQPESAQSGTNTKQSPVRHSTVRNKGTSQQVTANTDTTHVKTTPVKGSSDFQPGASTSTAGLGRSPRKTTTNNQPATSTNSGQHKQSPVKTWSPKKYISTHTYKYQNLDSVKPNTVVDVYGVVKFCKPPYKTRGSDYCMIVTLVDPTLYGEDKKLKCLLFNREKEKLPNVKVGDILRFHRLKISTYCGERQGQNSPGFAWLVFSGKQGASLDPISTSSINYTFTDDDKKKIEETRDWIEGQEELRDGDPGCCIEDLVPGLYFDLSCQVIATSVIEEGVFVLLRVWDGTKTIYPVRDFDTEAEDHVVNSDPALLDRAKDFMYDVALYDDHAIKNRNIQPGQFIKLCNLHAAKYVNVEIREDLSALPTVELVIHRGTSFGRGVVFLSRDWPDVQMLKEKFDRVCPPRDEFEDSLNIDELSPLPSASERQNKSASKRRLSSSGNIEDSEDTNLICKKSKADSSSSGKHSEEIHSNTSPSKRVHLEDDGVRTRSQRKSRKSSSDLNISLDQPELEMTCDQVTQTNTQESVPRCMLETATVVLNHPFIKKTKLQDVLTHEVPYKFRILAHVEDYFPKADKPEDFIKLYCPNCHYLQSPTNTPDSSSASGGKKLTIKSTKHGVKHYYCPRCKENEENCEDSTADSTIPVLEYIYMMRFLLNDGSGWLIANIWREEAVTFFKDIEAVKAYTNKKLFTEVKDCLNQICPGEGQQKPWIECCVKSYSVQEGTGFQIFDTAIA